MNPKCLAKSNNWSRGTHICVGYLTIIRSDHGLSPSRREDIIWTNAIILVIGPLGTNLSEILIEVLTFSFHKVRFKVSSAVLRPCCLGLCVLNTCWSTIPLEGFPVVWDSPGKSYFVTTLLMGCTGLRSMKLLLLHASWMLITAIKCWSFLFIT